MYMFEKNTVLSRLEFVGIVSSRLDRVITSEGHTLRGKNLDYDYYTTDKPVMEAALAAKAGDIWQIAHTTWEFTQDQWGDLWVVRKD